MILAMFKIIGFFYQVLWQLEYIYYRKQNLGT